MTVLATLASEHDTVPAPEPFTTIGAILLLLLLVVYVAGLPATTVLAVVFWRQRTRSRPTPMHTTAAVAPPGAGDGPVAEPPHSTYPSSLSSVSPAGEALLHLQAVEQQVLSLRQSPPAADNCLRLATATTGLLTRHGEHSTVGGYAAGLRAIVAGLAPLHTAGVSPAEPPSPPTTATGILPDLLRVALARCAAEGRAIPERWAFCWYGHLTDRWPPQADGRRDEIAQAFAHQYRRMYPHGGMIIPLTGDPLVLHYTPAGARYGGQPLQITTHLVDIASSSDAVRRLAALGTAALAELRPPVTS